MKIGMKWMCHEKSKEEFGFIQERLGEFDIGCQETLNCDLWGSTTTKCKISGSHSRSHLPHRGSKSPNHLP